MRFSLRHLLILVTLLAIICGEAVEIVRLRQETAKQRLQFRNVEREQYVQFRKRAEDSRREDE